MKCNAKPFLKWVGGKRKSAVVIEENLPLYIRHRNVDRSIEKYFEPFVGGGAVFFHLNSLYNIKQAYLGDVNEALIKTYEVVRDTPNLLISALLTLQERYNLSCKSDYHKSEFYGYKRDSFNVFRNTLIRDYPVQLASLFIFLNKTCYNGLYRENNKGEFNTPLGSYKNPKICDEETILAAHEALQGVTLIHGDYTKCLKDAKGSESFVYLDPPYAPPPKKTSGFTKYTKAGFNEAEQIRLRTFFHEQLFEEGTLALMSNSKTPFVERVYTMFGVKTIKASRTISCKGKDRQSVEEVLIGTYELIDN